jgi:GrpB-like predicted nucleotidyltransferase (UPF0157 family)
MDVYDVLGLEKSVVALAPHNPRWNVLGSQECQVVRRLLGSVAIDVRHVGSTAVPELVAKPILDIAVAVGPDVPIHEIVRLMTSSGDYSFDSDRGADGGLLFVRGSGDFRTAHIHVVREGSREWEMYLRFHDLLVSNSSARARYEATKRLLAGQFSGDRPAYTAAKGAVIKELLGD